jgi:GT2 family glycosyltransferase
MDSSTLNDTVAMRTRLPLAATLGRPATDRRAAHIATPRISIAMPTTGYAEPFERCFRQAIGSLRPDLGDELLVVFDGAAPPPPAWLAESGATLLATGHRVGPAAARNLAAEAAHGDVLFFVDADVELAPDALERVRAAFTADPDLCGVFGAYDAEPAAPGLVSRFRNLLHHHTHLRHAGPAETFWSGCGAMRTGAFLDLGGFDARYREPSIEDIELGSRAVAAGGRLRLDPAIACTHHKRWTLGSMIFTDVFRRAVPWTRHMLAMGNVTQRLNLDWRSRASGACAVLAGLAALAAPFLPWAVVPMLACLAAILLMNHDFYALCTRQGGLAFAAGSFLLHWLYFAYATLTFAVLVAQDRLRRVSCAR